MTKALATLAAGLALLTMPFGANALTLDQDILISGTLTSFTTSDQGSTGTITFGPPTSVQTGAINGQSLIGDTATLSDLTLPLSGSGSTVWSIFHSGATYTFTLDSVTSYGNSQNSSLPGYLSRIITYSGFGSVSDGTEIASAQIAVTLPISMNLTTGQWSGGQMNLTVSAVPIPAAGWLFGSALVGLAGVARRKSQS